jgi:hypothetical protein
MKNDIEILEYPKMKGYNYAFVVNGKYLYYGVSIANVKKQFKGFSSEKITSIIQQSKFPSIV